MNKVDEGGVPTVLSALVLRVRGLEREIAVFFFLFLRLFSFFFFLLRRMQKILMFTASFAPSRSVCCGYHVG